MNRNVCPACGRARPGLKAKPKRDANIVKMYARGMSCGAIGAQVGLSRQRVARIVKEAESRA